MSNYTPGPWHTEVAPSSDLHFIRGIYSDDAGQIAKVRVGPVLEQDEALANARLLAAAPELLAALEGLCGLAELRPGHLQDYKSAVSDARAVIVKAKGG